MKDNLRYTILYVRISKDDDTEGDSNSITTQLAILQKHSADHGYQNIRVIKDDGYSGTNFDRPDFQRMLEDAEERDAQTEFRVLYSHRSRARTC